MADNKYFCTRCNRDLADVCRIMGGDAADEVWSFHLAVHRREDDYKINQVKDKLYALVSKLDGSLFRQQRHWLNARVNYMSKTCGTDPLLVDELESAEGLRSFLDDLADIAHDDMGIDCLLEGD